MAKKKRQVRQKGVNKAQFILSQPMDLSAKEVIERAKAQGISLSESYVHVIRSKYRRGTVKKREQAQPVAAAAAATTTATKAKTRQNLEVEFRRLAVELGLDRAQELLQDTRQKLLQLFSQ